MWDLPADAADRGYQQPAGDRESERHQEDRRESEDPDRGRCEHRGDRLGESIAEIVDTEEECNTRLVGNHPQIQVVVERIPQTHAEAGRNAIDDDAAVLAEEEHAPRHQFPGKPPTARSAI